MVAAIGRHGGRLLLSATRRHRRGAGPASATPNAAVRVLPDGTWGIAKELPGLAVLNKGGDGVISSVSCASPGNCGAGGIYRDGASRTQAFVASQTNGTWGKAIQVPGTGALNVGGDAEIIALSCASPGNCSAGGEYSDHRDFFQAFVVTETNGTWGKAIQIPGSAALNLGDNAEVTALSCASPGNCSAAGHYGDSHGRHVFVVNQTNGTWGKAIQIPGTHLSRVEFAEVASVSCPAVGDCGASVSPTPPTWRSRSSSASGTGPGARPSRSPASRPSTSAGTAGLPACPAVRWTTAARRQLPRRFRPRPGVRRQRAERVLGQGHRGPGHRRP